MPEAPPLVLPMSLEPLDPLAPVPLLEPGLPEPAEPLVEGLPMELPVPEVELPLEPEPTDELGERARQSVRACPVSPAHCAGVVGEAPVLEELEPGTLLEPGVVEPEPTELPVEPDPIALPLELPEFIEPEEPPVVCAQPACAMAKTEAATAERSRPEGCRMRILLLR